MDKNEHDFLYAPNPNSVKRRIKNIVTSYSHYWDLLAELTQNSSDAIFRAKHKNSNVAGKIHLHIDYRKNTLHIMDNGVGIPKEELINCLMDSGSDKEDALNEKGEKGVGLTFSIFKGNYFRIQSREQNGSEYSAEVNNARDWLESKSLDNHPTVTWIESVSENIFGMFPPGSYTYLEISDIKTEKASPNIFEMSPLQLEFLLRTKTSIGETPSIFSDSFHTLFDCHFSYVLESEEGDDIQDSKQLDHGFPILHKDLKKQAMSVGEAQKKISGLSVPQQRDILHGRTIWDIRSVTIRKKSLQVYGVMFPSNDAFQEISDMRQIDFYPNTDFNQSHRIFTSGIFLACKGMPTGIEIRINSSARHPSYYKRCYFLVLDDLVELDTGRKNLVKDAQTARIQEVADELFMEFEKIAKYQHGSVDAENKETKREREKRLKKKWRQIDDEEDLVCEAICFGKNPKSQEAGVVAVFHELLGAKVLKQYKPLWAGHKERYDLYAHYGAESDPIVIEFKHDLAEICKNFDEATKYFSDIHLLVAWDADIQRLTKYGVTLVAIERDENPEYEGANFRLRIDDWPDPIYVLLLKPFIESLNTK